MDKPFPAYSGDDPYIFISYAHEDSDVVFPEIQWLKDQGFNLWYDEGISPGSEWHQELADRIDRCHLFLYFITPRSAASDHCQREVHYAIDNGKQLLAVHLEETELPSGINLSLGNMQAIMRHELPDLDYRIKLVKSASSHIERGVGVAAEPTPTIVGVSRKVTAAISIVTLLIGLLISAIALWNPQPTVQAADTPLRRFPLNTMPKLTARIGMTLAISNDGQHIYFYGRSGQESGIFHRDLEDVTEALVSGTEAGLLRANYSGGLRVSPDK